MILGRKYREKKMGFRIKLKGLLLFNCLIEEAERKRGISRNVSQKREWLIHCILFQKSNKTGTKKMYIRFGSREVYGWLIKLVQCCVAKLGCSVLRNVLKYFNKLISLAGLLVGFW